MKFKFDPTLTVDTTEKFVFKMTLIFILHISMKREKTEYITECTPQYHPVIERENSTHTHSVAQLAHILRGDLPMTKIPGTT